MSSKTPFPITLLTLVVAISFGTSAYADNQPNKPKACFVIGDTSENQFRFAPGSRLNPYGSLQEVEANTTCKKIVVLYSETTLDGGIQLADGQKIVGRKGPNGELPKITNTTERVVGAGIRLAQDNTVKRLHVLDTTSSAILGGSNFPPLVGGEIVLQGLKVSGANQAGVFLPQGIAQASILIGATQDTRVQIRRSTVGDARVTSIAHYQLAGKGALTVDRTTVQNQTQLSEQFELSPGIFAFLAGSADLDFKVTNSTVTNVGSEFASNSDGVLLAHQSSGHAEVFINKLRYSNPENRGYNGSSTGIELATSSAQPGATMAGSITNSNIDGAFLAGIQVIDDDPIGSATVDVTVARNRITNTLLGIDSIVDEAQNGHYSLTVINNYIETAPREGADDPVGFLFRLCCTDQAQDSVNLLLERNTIKTSGFGLLFYNFGALLNSSNIDAGWGNLGGSGKNRIFAAGDTQIEALDLDVIATNNWWGTADGPQRVVESGEGSVDVEPFLIRDPRRSHK